MPSERPGPWETGAKEGAAFAWLLLINAADCFFEGREALKKFAL